MFQKSIFYYLFFAAIIIIPGKIFAQNFEWLANTKATNSEYISRTVVDKSGNSYSIGGFQKFLQFNNDSTRFTNEDNSSFIVKYDKDGNLNWLRSFTRSQFQFLALDTFDNLFIYGDTRDTFNTTIGSIISASNQTTGFLLKVNTAGQTLLLKNLGLNSSVSVLNMKMDQSGNVFFVGSFINNFYIDGILVSKIGPVINTVDGFIAKFNSNLNSISWVRKASNCVFSDVSMDRNGNQYITGTLSGFVPYHVSAFGSVSLTAINNDAFIAKIGISGLFVWAKRIGGINLDQGESIIYKNGKLFFVGRIFGNVNFISDTVSSSPTNNQNGFIASSDTSGNLISYKLFKGVNSSVVNFDINNYNEILLIGTFNISLNLENLTINSIQPNTIFLAKLDLNLNPLWLLNVNSTGDPNCVVSTKNREYYFSGNLYTNYIQFGPFYRDLNFVGNNGFLVKISDISITSNHPFKRNYCSGDSLFLDYVTTGKFKQGNKFKVQLSDTAGNFDSLSTIIGTRLDTLSNTIACKIPMSILGSANYKLRIFSDNPKVYGYYDSTLYNIQVIPIANAGIDSSVCYGQIIKLGSILTNGQKYSWVPASLLNDSSLKQPSTKKGAAPLPNFFVLQASNQHCVSKDTVNVQFLKPLKITVARDTILCKNALATFKPIYAGGRDSNNYLINWYRNTFSSSIGSGKTILAPTDTLSVIYSIMNDGCSLPDTSSTSIHIASYRKLIIPSDTFLCSGKSLTIFSKNYRRDTTGYQLKWMDENWNLVVKEDTLNENYFTSTKRHLISDFMCKATADTASILIEVAPILKFALMPDTTLCFGKGFYLRGYAQGGDSSKYQMSWNQSVADTLNLWSYDSNIYQSEVQRYFQFSNDTLLHATLSDQCSMNTISDSVRVTVLPKLKVQNPLIPKVCEGSVLRLVGNAFYGKQPYLYSWLDPLNLSIFSTKDSLYIPSAKVSSYWLNAVDQCANRDSVLVQLNPDISPKADFNILDSVICADDIVKIENTSSNSQLLPMNYYWKWLNGSSTAQTPLPLLKTSGQYDLMLVTTLQNNCSDTFSKKNAFIVHPKPKANFTTDKTIVSKNDAFIQFSDLSLTQGLSNYLWNFGDGKISTETNPQNSFLNAGWYSVSLVVTNEFVCSDSINKYHLIWVQGGKSIYMPNAITLNNDGLNEDFKPYGDDVKSWQMEVYDRSGNEVFAGNQDTGGFKGKDRNSIPLSIGVYIYRVAVTTGDNETYYFKGTITILR